MIDRNVGLLGATSLVGTGALQLLMGKGFLVTAYSRNAIDNLVAGVSWRTIEPKVLLDTSLHRIRYWLCVAPIWVMPEHFNLLLSHGARRLVVLSSTSRFGKMNSEDLSERHLAQRLANAEENLQRWAEEKNIELIILRPTLIYGLGQDKNVSEISRFIHRFGFFPVFGKAEGLRQPIHVEDVANSCVTALLRRDIPSGAYNLSGGETLPYREMITCIFKAMRKKPKLLSIPLWLFMFAIGVLRFIPRYKQWSYAMAQRMNQDLVFDHSDAKAAFGFNPRGFVLKPEDLPK